MIHQNILITGASRGIGKTCAFAFAQKGNRLFLNCRNSIEELKQVCKEITALGVFCQPLPGDVGSPDDVRRMFQVIEQACAGIDILINNAGIAHIGLLSDMTDDEWNRVIQTNLSSVFYTSRAAIPHMVSKKSGKIINISSMWGNVGASCEAAYSASKAGIHGLTKALAKELGPSNVQVNAVACGIIDTAMNSRLSASVRQALTEDIPAGRFGTPEEVASLIYDLAHSPAYLTGQIIGLDGGYI